MRLCTNQVFSWLSIRVSARDSFIGRSTASIRNRHMQAPRAKSVADALATRVNAVGSALQSPTVVPVKLGGQNTYFDAPTSEAT